jgi:adenosylhomocysteine nucleosidase
LTTLVVAALHEEVAHVRPGNGIEVLVTGVGKAVAAAVLAKRLADGPHVGLVVNVGTAGSVDGVITGLVEIDYVTQHDLPYEAIDELTADDVVRGYALSPGQPPESRARPAPTAHALATGDVFVADAEHARRIAASGIHVVDMEGFAFAATCAVFGVPMRCIKIVSDFADQDAGESWLDTIDSCARELGDWVDCHIRAG